MSTAEKLTIIASNVQSVYNAGKAKELCDFWEDLQASGNRVNYDRAFAGWTSQMSGYFTPKYSMTPTNAYMMFANNTALTDLVQKFSELNISFDTSNCTYFSNFLFSSTITHVGIISTLSIASIASAFSHATLLQTIDKLILKQDGTQILNNTFDNCTELTQITIDGTIGQNVNFKWSTKLNAQSINSIITHLSDTSVDMTLTLPTTARSNYDSIYGTGSFDTFIASKSNWTISLI